MARTKCIIPFVTLCGSVAVAQAANAAVSASLRTPMVKQLNVVKSVLKRGREPDDVDEIEARQIRKFE